MRTRTIATLVVVAGCLVLSACGEVKKKSSEVEEPAQVVTLEGTDQEAVVVEENAAQRTGIETEPTRASTKGMVTIPHAAVFYGLEGEAWTYASPEPLTYVRTPIEIDHIDGDTAFLTNGPSPGTEVVIVGAPELFGVEEGVGH
jgi:hypothetical protein